MDKKDLKQPTLQKILYLDNIIIHLYLLEMAKKIRTVASILRGIKRAARKKPRTQKQKEVYLEGMARKMDRKPTTPEILFKSLLEELEIPFETQKIVGGKIYDFYIPSKNLIVEVDGTYWHAKDVEIKDMNQMQRRSVNNDKRKDVIARGSGYQIERVWEDELMKEYELTKARFKYLLID